MIAIIAIESANLIAIERIAIIIAIESASYFVPTETATCRINYIQKLSLAEIMPLRDSFSYNKKIEPLSSFRNSFRITCTTKWRNSRVHCINELCCILIISIFLSSYILQTK